MKKLIVSKKGSDKKYRLTAKKYIVPKPAPAGTPGAGYLVQKVGEALRGKGKKIA